MSDTKQVQAETTDAVETTPPEVEQRDDDEVLDDIFGAEDDGEPVAKASDDAAEEEKETPAATAEDGTDSDDALASVDPEDYRKGLAALQRAKLPSDELDKLSPAAVVAMGSRAAEQQADQDRLGNQLDALKKQVEEQGTAADGTTEPADADALLQPLLDEYGAELADPIKQYLAAKASEQSETTNAVLLRLEAFERQQARAQLGETYPQLSEDERFDAVVNRMNTLAKTGEYSDTPTLMHDAARLEFADEQLKQFQDSLRGRHAQRDNGQPATETTTTPPAAMSETDLEDAQLDAILAGDPEAAERLARQSA